jgi:predicted amidophosphoribosyltransferase
MGWRHALDLILPRTCASCARPSDPPLCDPCSSALPWIPLRSRCMLCQSSLDDAGPRLAAGFCAECAALDSPLDRCAAAVWLEGDVHGWIRRFKYPAHGLAGLDPGSGAIACDLARAAGLRMGSPEPDCVIPIPLHPHRLRARGFNPAGLLAKSLAHEIDMRVDYDLLIRVRDTPPQTGRGRRARRENMAGAFGCRTRRVSPPLRVWLVDDVVTTGATLRAAATALRGAGVREVIALCAARTPAPGGRVEGRDGSG